MFVHKITPENAESFCKSAGTYLKDHGLLWEEFFSINDLKVSRRNIVDIRKKQQKGYKAVGFAYPFTQNWIMLMDKDKTESGRIIMIEIV